MKCSIGVRKSVGLLLVVLLFPAVVLNTPASATSSSTFSVTADAYVAQATPKGRYGAEKELRVAGSPTEVTYLRFAITTLPGPVARATLRLNALAASPSDVDVHRVADINWNEKAISWSTRPPLGSVIARSAVPAGWISIDVTSAITSGQAVSFGISTTSSSVTFASRETGATGPQLIVETNPAPDTTPPAAPSGLSATGRDGSVAVDWADNTETDLAGYRLYRRNTDGTWPTIPLAAPSQSQATDTTVVNGTTYAYRVTAVDLAGNESSPTTNVSATPAAAPDTTPPAAPSGLSATGRDGSVAVDWADNTETDLAGYRLYRRNTDGTWPTIPLAAPSQSQATDTTVVNGTTYAYRVTAVDLAGNESSPSNDVSATPAATALAPLCSPRSLYTDSVMTAPRPVGYWRLGELSGTTACDSAGTSSGTYRHGYRLAQPGLLVGDENTSLALDGTSGHVTVPSVSSLNPSGPFSLETWVTPATLSVDQTLVRKNNQFLLRLTSTSVFFRVWWSDSTYTELRSSAAMEVGLSQHLVASYDGTAMRIYRNGALIASRTAAKTPASTTNTILIGQSGGYDYYSGRIDEIAQYSTALTADRVANHYVAGRGGPDSTPPAPPTGLVATAGDASVSLDWSDSPEPDMASYRVYRRISDGTWGSEAIQSPVASAATDTSVVNGTTYEYRVTALDLSGNESSPSSPVSAAPAGPPPPPPTDVRAIGGATAIGLRWTNSRASTSYHIYRRISDGVWPVIPLAVVDGSVSMYIDEGAPSSATYRITAVDASGTESQPSFEASASLAPDVILAAGDIAGCDTSGDEATAAILDGQSGTVVTLGDNVYPNGTPQEFEQCYHPTWGRQLWRTRPAVGNHEYRTAGAAGYFSYFGTAAGDPSKGYYSFEQAGWHIVVLNANCKEVGGCGAGSPQEQWLRKDLAMHPARCTAAVIHNPRFSSGAVHGSQAAMQPFWEALYDGGAELVLSGDDHIYERFAPQTPDGKADPERGIRQFVVGTGGRVHYSFGTVQPNSEVRHTGTFGVLKLTLAAGSYNWAFLPEAGKTFTDTGSRRCH